MVGVNMANTLFTIEQVELIRRLRNTGIAKEQVVEAFEQLERLDGESKKPSSLGGSQRLTSLSSSNPNCSVSSSCNFETSTTTLNETNGLNITITKVESLPGHLTNGSSIERLSLPVSRPNSGSTSCSDSYPETPISHYQNGDCSPTGRSATSPASRLPSEITIIPLSSTPSSSSSGGPLPEHSAKPQLNNDIVPLQCLVNPMDFYQDDILQELEELKNKKTEEQILSEIRNFVMRYNIKQTMIAEMTKMSQAYVSRFFRGDTSDMSDRTKNMFYTWFLTCKNNPWKLAQLCPNSGVKRMVSDSGDLIPLKRERFTFKAAHLAILEKYYEKDPYPDNDTREKIMEECNRAVSKDRFLSEKEKLTPAVVSNWFNNRRKEAKKLMRQQHAAAMAGTSSGGGSLSQQAMFLPSPSSNGWSSGLPPGINFGSSVAGATSVSTNGGGAQSSAAILQQHLSSMAQSSSGVLRHDSHPQLDLSCEVDSDSSGDSNNGSFDAADHLMMELREDDCNRLSNIKTET